MRPANLPQNTSGCFRFGAQFRFGVALGQYKALVSGAGGSHDSINTESEGVRTSGSFSWLSLRGLRAVS